MTMVDYAEIKKRTHDRWEPGGIRDQYRSPATDHRQQGQRSTDARFT
jgi:hypothetical protein